MTALAPPLQAYFTQRLIGERAASPNTIASYKLTFQLLLAFASKATRKAPSSLDIADLDAPLIASFLEHLEQERRNSVATRNSRLAAIHSLFGYLALRHPEHAGSIQRVLAVPPKRTEGNLVTYLSDAEASALLGACDLTRWTGRRDHAMFALAIQTGLRISELAGLTRGDVTLTAGACVRTLGKGRKERATPLIPSTVAVLKAWLAEQPGTTADPLFPTTTGRHLSRDAIERPRCPGVKSRPALPLDHGQARHRRHTSAHRGHAPAPGRQRHHRHSPLAWPRADHHDTDLPARRHEPQAASHRAHPPARRQARPLPAQRHHARVLAGPLIMPTSSGRSPPLSRASFPTSA
ncbi:MAG TPA: tyrosine-type recombinase/integrase [Solirubrobacteraceae bacterium]|nr:tyrosine-type recombinase/integrase [Solirubrobacteraceae bacterium]